MKQVQIIKIEQIQNFNIWNLYRAEQKNMLDEEKDLKLPCS